MDDATIARLAHLNYQEFSRMLSRWSGAAGRLREEDGLLCWATATDFAVLLNGASRTDPALPAGEVLGRASAWFGGAPGSGGVGGAPGSGGVGGAPGSGGVGGAPGSGGIGRGFTLDVRRGPDDDVIAAADAAGLVPVLESPQMVCAEPLAGPDARPDVQVEWVDDVAGVEAFVGISDDAYQSLGMPAGVIAASVVDPDRMLEPHVMIVVVRDGGRPVASALSFLSHGVAGVHYVGVLDGARGRGLGELVTRLVTNRAFERGAAFVGLQASSMGESGYRRMGYREIYRYVSYVDFATS